MINRFKTLLENFTTPQGFAEIQEEFSQYKSKYGEKWLTEFKLDYPDLSTIIDLIANNTADDAFLKFKDFAKTTIEREMSGKSNFFIQPAVFAAMVYFDNQKPLLMDLHGKLKAEIDRPRF